MSNENTGKINLYIKLGFLSTRGFVLSSNSGETRTSINWGHVTILKLQYCIGLLLLLLFLCTFIFLYFYFLFFCYYCQWSAIKKKTVITLTSLAAFSLQKHPFLLALRRWGCFARRIPYWWRKTCPESGEKRWLVDGVVTLF